MIFSISAKALALSVVLGAASYASATVMYTIQDLGTIGSSDASQGYRISGNGTATGRNLGTTYKAFRYTKTGGMVWLDNLTSPARGYGAGNGVNNSGTVVGTGTTNSRGSNKYPVMWLSGSTTATALTLPTGYTIGDANDINDSNVIVGSVGSGSGQRAVVYQNGTGTVLGTTSAGVWTTLFAINNSGIAVGSGTDTNGALTYAMVYDTNTGLSTNLGCLTALGHNGGIAYDVSDNGYVVGSSFYSGANTRPFIWSASTGMVEIALPTGTSIGSARGVNSSGWVVGNASSSTAIPFLYDGTTTYRLADLIVDYSSSGWDLLSNTSTAAYGISEDGTIIGTAVHNGSIHAFIMTQAVPEPATLGALAIGLVGLACRRKKAQK